MALVINTNVSSLNAQRNVSNTQNALATSLQRLSSGLRVNSAKDDAAGMFSIERMNADIRGLNQAVRNAGDGISLAQTGEGAMSQIQANLQRIREIAVQSANATIEDRSGLQAETDQLTQELSRIVQTTQFNGTALLSSSSSLNFQVGQNGTAANQVSINTAVLTGITGYAADLTGSGTVVVSTQASASAAIASLDSAINTVSTSRATFGAVQNRFEAVISNLQNYAENLTAARSRIQDTDFAMETANLTKAQVMQQAGVAMLSQANAGPQSVLALLR